MGKREVVLVLLIALCYGVAVGFNGEDEHWRREKSWEERKTGREEQFLLKDSKHMVKTEAGEMEVVRSPRSSILERPMHIGFITMEPKSLFVPQYMDTTLILFVRRGEAKVGFIYKDKPAERRLKTGDVYRIPAGTVFYLVNVAEGQRLQIICSVDTAESLDYGTLQSFFIAGGSYPGSVLAGFDSDTLATAFNVSYAELRTVLTRQKRGPIVYVTETEAPSVWKKFLQVKDKETLNKMADSDEEDEKEKNETWSWRKLLVSVFGDHNRDSTKTRAGKSPDSYNLFERTPDFRNEYGWSVAIDESVYSPLRHSDIGVYLVNLTAGSMMAPHMNPRAAEYGIVLKGCGKIQIVFPNGTSAMDTEVCEGDVFWIPRYFPFCQIASRTGPFEFFGFTTSARKNRPQFLVGASSILHALRGPELATAFGVTQEDLQRVLEPQREAVILPSAEVAPPHKEEEKQRREEEKKEREREQERERGQEKERGRGQETRVEEMMNSLEKNMVMGWV